MQAAGLELHRFLDLLPTEERRDHERDDVHGTDVDAVKAFLARRSQERGQGVIVAPESLVARFVDHEGEQRSQRHRLPLVLRKQNERVSPGAIERAVQGHEIAAERMVDAETPVGTTPVRGVRHGGEHHLQGAVRLGGALEVLVFGRERHGDGKSGKRLSRQGEKKAVEVEPVEATEGFGAGARQARQVLISDGVFRIAGREPAR